MDEAELTVNELAETPPNETPVTFVKPVPTIDTEVPPEDVPVLGETPVTVGPLSVNVNWSLAGLTLELPIELMTTMSTTPAE